MRVLLKPAYPLAPKPAVTEIDFWSVPAEDLLRELQTDASAGLTSAEAARRLARSGPNVLAARARATPLTLLLRQFTSPIVLLLIAAAVLSFALHDRSGSGIILVIVVVSGVLGFWQEHGATAAVEKLLQAVELKATVLRDQRELQIPVRDVVPGDIVLLSAGSGVPADCRLLEEQDLFVDEAALTGESYPVDKTPGVIAAGAPLAQRSNALYLGTHAVSGSGKAVVVHTGRATEFGEISARLRMRPPETEFEHGVRHFGSLLLELTLLLVTAIFAVNVYLQRPVLDSLMFALALAVGLTPQLLPAIISVNLSRGARDMAAKDVIVKRLAAIENLGAMNVLCSDKTGTLTEGRVRVHAALDADGHESETVLLHAFINATFETTFTNPIDAAIRAHRVFPLDGWRKLDEVPYDFTRKRLSVLAAHEGSVVLITKGALVNVLAVCTTAQNTDGSARPLEQARASIEARHAELGAQGFRTLGVAVRELGSTAPVDRSAETGMTFVGLIALADPPKADVTETVTALRRLGVSLKMITGDSALVATHVSTLVGVSQPRVLTGTQLNALSDAALPIRAVNTDVFAEIEPSQKERIVHALRKAGHVVGYIGDGINDAPALHAADVSISVQSAVDVAKEAADIVLLKQDLSVLEAGVREGRRTFANTLKYVFMATSANFGNMFSMAGASLFLPFLPLLPKQILLTNLLTDFPELTIATDRVDADWIDRPRRWNIRFIRSFMLTFGLVSSVFDYLTFAVLIWVLHTGPAEFRTGWFVESVVSATLIVLVLRTRYPFFRSVPSRALAATSLAIVLITFVLPFTRIGTVLGFVPLPPRLLGIIALLVVAYVVSAELAKRWFYRRQAEVKRG